VYVSWQDYFLQSYAIIQLPAFIPLKKLKEREQVNPLKAVLLTGSCGKLNPAPVFGSDKTATLYKNLNL